MLLDPDFSVHSPPSALRPYIAHYMGYRAHGLKPSVHSGLPSRHAGLIISLAAEPIDVVRMPGAGQRPGVFRALVGGLQIYQHLTPGIITPDEFERALGLLAGLYREQ